MHSACQLKKPQMRSPMWVTCSSMWSCLSKAVYVILYGLMQVYTVRCEADAVISHAKILEFNDLH